MIITVDRMNQISLSDEGWAGVKSICSQLHLSVSELLEQLGQSKLAIITREKLVIAHTEIKGNNQTWLDPDPYDWGPDGQPKGKPVEYIPGVGMVVWS
ncbi:MAG: hypothetical protein GDA43_25345 [Hormoscilla sp. SP5CHS1]|nr:hypothetical protein [Hormoscilla sp. SP12CHS1]MBC6456095.1 hypothetical protein [Hormoscilla sp. SP5CHS1]